MGLFYDGVRVRVGLQTSVVDAKCGMFTLRHTSHGPAVLTKARAGMKRVELMLRTSTSWQQQPAPPPLCASPATHHSALTKPRAQPPPCSPPPVLLPTARPPPLTYPTRHRLWRAPAPAASGEAAPAGEASVRSASAPLASRSDSGPLAGPMAWLSCGSGPPRVPSNCCSAVGACARRAP